MLGMTPGDCGRGGQGEEEGVSSSALLSGFYYRLVSVATSYILYFVN